MKMVRLERTPVIALLVPRGVFFFFGFCVLSVTLYALGTIQGFTAPSQRLLLALSFIGGLLLAVFSVYGLILIVWRGIQRDIPALRVVFGLLCHVILGVFGALIAVGAASILILAGGNGL
jgi:hypothetical protein